MLEGVTVFCHSSIKIVKDRVVYFDPFKIEEEYKDADVIFITHDTLLSDYNKHCIVKV